MWDEETAIAGGVDRLERKVQQANDKSLRLHLIPAEAKNAGGVSHQIELLKHLLPTEPHKLLNLDPSAVVKPSLAQLKERFARELAAAQDQKLEAEEAETKRLEEAQARATPRRPPQCAPRVRHLRSPTPGVTATGAAAAAGCCCCVVPTSCPSSHGVVASRRGAGAPGRSGAA